MRSTPRLALYWGIGCAAAFAVVAAFVSTGYSDGFDRPLTDGLHNLESDGWTAFLKTAGSVASGIPVAVIIALVCLYLLLARRIGEWVTFIAVLAGSQAVNLALKELFQRERPDVHRLIEASGYGFPSGNATSALALFGMLAVLGWSRIPSRAGRTALVVICSFFTLAAGVSRIYLGVHYPTDIAGAYLSTGAVLFAALAIRARITVKRHPDSGVPL
ncbi:phosphatase PAP2 family protein [Paenibacillus protaetiae]|nr:phosphatase PAP2 family protein [Paenibacillus protaetiae]